MVFKKRGSRKIDIFSLVPEAELQRIEAGILPMTITGELTELMLLDVNGRTVGSDICASNNEILQPLLQQSAREYTAIKVVSKENHICGKRHFLTAHYSKWYHLSEHRWRGDEIIDIGRYVPCYDIAPYFYQYATCRGQEITLADEFEYIPSLRQVDDDLDNWSNRWWDLDAENCADIAQWDALNDQGKRLAVRVKAILGGRINVIFHDTYPGPDQDGEKAYFIVDVRETLRNRQPTP